MNNGFAGTRDEALIESFALLVETDRRTSAAMLVHLEEIDRRQLWTIEGYSSMFAWCTERFHMSASKAGKRIYVARLARRFPEILGKVERGELHLSGLTQLGKVLTEENHVVVLERAKHKTERQLAELVAEIAPRPDVASRITAVVRRGDEAACANELVGAPLLLASGAGLMAPAPLSSTRGAPHEPEPALSNTEASFPASVPKAPASTVTPLSPGRYKIQITVGRDTHDTLRRLQDLMSHSVRDGDPAAIIERALSELLESTLRKRAAATRNPRAAISKISASVPKPSASVTATASASATRTIPAHVRRVVWQRDEAACAFVSSRGRRCGEMRFVQFHHKHPFACGGEANVKNIELRCAAHNQLEARFDFGASYMESKRRGVGLAAPSRR